MKRQKAPQCATTKVALSNNLFPAFINLAGKRCVVVGAGAVAQRKITRLHACKARIVVVSPRATSRIATMAERGDLVWHQKPWHARYLAGAFLVFAATDDRALNLRVAAACKKRGIPVNVVDNPQQCDFMVPAVVRRGNLCVAVSTGGTSPAFAAYLRRLLQETLSGAHGDLLGQLAALRRTLQDMLPQGGRRRNILKSLPSSAILALKAHHTRKLSGNEQRHASDRSRT